MKISKKILLLVVPIILLAAALAVALIFTGVSATPSFMGYSYYVRMMLKDKFFVRLLVNTFVPSVVCSAIVVIALAVLRCFVKPLKKDKIFYPVGVASASVAAFVASIISKLASGFKLVIFISFFEIIVLLIIGFLTMLLFLLAETLFGFYKEKARKR